MARKKKGDGALVGVVLLGAFFGLLASIPKPVWIFMGVCAVIGVIWLLFFNGKTPPTSTAQRETPLRGATPTTVSAPPKKPVVPQSRATTVEPEPEPEPVSLFQRPNATEEHRIPAAPKNFGPATWIAPGESTNIAGIAIPGGMIYVGTSLPTPSGLPDPALIDPSKKVASRGSYTSRNQMDYWPSYSSISPEARYAYLQWLAGGRRDPSADIGYVFLFFYGLERRALVDIIGSSSPPPDSKKEFANITAEVRQLLAVYGVLNHSFHRYAQDFLTIAEVNGLTGKLYSRPLPELHESYELPLYLRLALGQCAIDEVAVPSTLARAWVRRDPNIYLRTPAVRCAEQFDLLFEQRYVDMLAGGLVLPKNKTKLKLVYRPASAGFRGVGEMKLTFGDIPDVSVQTRPIKKLQEVADSVMSELDPFSRMLSRTPNADKTLSGLLLLPPTLWPSEAREKLNTLQSRAAAGLVTMKLQDLVYSIAEESTFERNVVQSLARALEAHLIGMEPDILSGAKTPKPDDTVVLFSIPIGDTIARDNAAYQTAALTIQLAISVAMADGDLGAEELRQLRHQIEGWTHLTPAHQQRLRAYMRLLIATPPSLTSLKKKLEPLSLPAKESIAKFMTVMAQADGEVSPAEIKALEKVYKTLGVDSKKVFSDVHATASTGTATSVTSTVQKPGTSEASSTGFQLDTARIAALQQDTSTVSALLANIFAEEPMEPTGHSTEIQPTTVETPAEVDTAPVHSVMGLDEVHTTLVNQLISRPEWTREELLDLASDLDLMLDGALEKVNEAAYDAHDEPLTEGDDPVTVNREILEKLAA